MQDVKTIKLGNEYDAQIFEKCAAWLAARPAVLLDAWNGVAGSQDVGYWKYLVDGQVIEIEVETYIGFTVTGPPSIVDQIAAETGR
jgi:hypothetical protein